MNAEDALRDDMLDLWRKQSVLNHELADEIAQLHAELAEVRDELVTHEARHRRDVNALRESIRATDRVLNDRTAHLA